MNKTLIGTLLLIAYLLLFAFIYFCVGNLDDKTAHFRSLENNEELKMISFWECFYFAVITQTTVGYGRIQPKSLITEALVVIQCLSTIFFPFGFGFYMLGT